MVAILRNNDLQGRLKALSLLDGRGPGLGLAAAHGAALPGPGLGAGGAHGTQGGPGRLDDGHLGPARLFRPEELLLGLGPVPLVATLGPPLALPDRVGPGAHLVLPFLVHALPPWLPSRPALRRPLP